MDRHTFIGKRKVGRTEICDFTDYQGIGRDPLYKRFESVNSIIKKAIDPLYIHFLAAPDYSADIDAVNWYIDEWSQTPERLVDLSGNKKEKYQKIKDDTVAYYKNVLNGFSGEELQVMACALRYIDDEFIYCCDDKVFLLAWGMTPDTRKHISKGELVHEAPCLTKFKLTFNAGEHGYLTSKYSAHISLAEGTEISANDIPMPIPKEGYEFAGWEPDPLDCKVVSDMTFNANYNESTIIISPEPPKPPQPPIPQDVTCRFDAGNYGILKGNSTIIKAIESTILANEIPKVLPQKGYKFQGWDINPLNYIATENTTFNALYKKLPWYKRFWLWFAGKRWRKWLLWLLLAILVALLLSWLLPQCHGCKREVEVNGVIESPKKVTPSGDSIDDNGVITPIEIDNGRLPDGDAIVAPIHNEDGNNPPIVRDPGVPPVVANRLFLFLENENDNVDAFAADFKKAYPEDKYSIIGFDRDVKSLLIQIPDAEKDEIRRTINNRIPNHKFIVFDEEIYELKGKTSSSSKLSPGWHLRAVRAKEAWDITKGSPSVIVAVVDDGIDATHPIFKDRIVNAYNVFTKNNQLSNGDGHGTHTAGLAVGSSQYFAKGASGIAPNCKLMPIQVFDNKLCPLSALVSGIMYAVHKGADVVNISIGPSFKGLNQLPVELQDEIAKTQFKNVEKLWIRVCKLAASKNTILVFAAGNDDILSSIPPENRTSVAITVGAVDQKLYPTDFTNYGPCTDISAPGKDIYSSFPVKSFQSCDGTSMSAPIVTGAIALMKSLKKDLSVKQAFNVLYKTGADVYGYMPPMVQVNLALDAVKRGDFSDPTPRKLRPVPDAHASTPDAPASWRNPDAVVIVDDDSNAIVAPDESVTNPGENTHPDVREPLPDNKKPQPEEDNGSNYDAIRRMIAIYKQKIIELEGKLPENKR